MNKVLFLVAGILLSYTFCVAGNNNSYMVHHANWWNTKANDNLSDVLMEVTPKGLYADVQLTFTLNGTAITTGPNDSLQGIINFELPPNSFIYDSWLWLNDSVIIRAAMIERGQAVQIYSGYIQRKQDPSLLVKTGTNTYQLNVFPITNSFARKVKISFSTLMKQVDGKAMLTLPTDLLTSSNVDPDITLTINSGNGYAQPYFEEANYSNLIVTSQGNADVLSVPAGVYSAEKELTLVYYTGTGPRLTIYPTGQFEGVYELQMPAENTTVAPRHLNFILDHRPLTTSYSYTEIYKFEEIKKYLRTFLLTNCRPTDSFNIFYVNNGSVVQAFPTWTAIDGANVSAALGSIPNTISSDQSMLQSLLQAGILFGQTKQPAEEHTVFISTNRDYTTLQSTTTFFNTLSTAVGAFTNKISVISDLKGNFSEILFNNLTAASGGILYKYKSSFYDGYLNRYTYDLDVRSILMGILHYMSPGSTSYDVILPVSTGFSYNTYNLSGGNKHFSWQPYCETGQYFGNMSPGFATINYLVQGSVMVHQVPIAVIDTGSKHQKRSWTNNYLLELESLNNPQLAAEIMDSSVNNRVLCFETAFLALENGDTIGTEDDTAVVATSVEETDTKTVSKVKCFPNPFSANMTIESPDEIDMVEVFDITGRLVFCKKDVRSKTFAWNGLNSDGQNLNAGIYIIRVKHKGSVDTIKVQKI